MTAPQQLEKSFWRRLESDRTVMLGTAACPPRPMTAVVEEDGGPIWFFTAKETQLAESLALTGSPACLTLSGKGHDIFATAEGTLTPDTSRAVIDRLWNPYIAAWYQGGKDDPKLQLLRFDGQSAQIWENGSSLVAGIKILLGVDPKKDYRDKVAKVAL